jgi:V/A-type H+-transporting ATPase subunit I
LKPFTKSRQVPETGRRFGTLMLYCGISASVFGVLYGSAFGFEFRSLWIKPMEQIMLAFKYGVFFGIGMISLGIVINVINAFFDRNYAKAIFDKAGLIGGVIYWAAIGLVSKVFFSAERDTGMYLLIVFAGVGALFLYPMIENMFFKKHGSVGEAFIESMINILEIFMGYLSNTVSFIRVAAFALAHAGLFLAIFSLSQASAKQPGVGTMVSWLVIVGGNVLVVCLEGLVVSIQSVRLNYYEFFSKFFIAGKQVYKPLSLVH